MKTRVGYQLYEGAQRLGIAVAQLADDPTPEAVNKIVEMLHDLHQVALALAQEVRP